MHLLSDNNRIKLHPYSLFNRMLSNNNSSRFKQDQTIKQTYQDKVFSKFQAIYSMIMITTLQQQEPQPQEQQLIQDNKDNKCLISNNSSKISTVDINSKKRLSRVVERYLSIIKCLLETINRIMLYNLTMDLLDLITLINITNLQEAVVNRKKTPLQVILEEIAAAYYSLKFNRFSNISTSSIMVMVVQEVQAVHLKVQREIRAQFNKLDQI